VNHGVRSGDADLARDQTLFALLMGIRESSIAEVYVRGSRVTAAQEIPVRLSPNGTERIDFTCQ